ASASASARSPPRSRPRRPRSSSSRAGERPTPRSRPPARAWCPWPDLPYPLPTFRRTLAPFGSVLPALGLSESTRPFCARVECFLVTFPTPQWARAILLFALASFCPTTFGTRHFGGVTGGGGG